MNPSTAQAIPPRRNVKHKWPRIRKHKVGRYEDWLVDSGFVDGKRVRKTRKRREEAETYAEQVRVARKNEGLAAFSLSPSERTEAGQSP